MMKYTMVSGLALSLALLAGHTHEARAQQGPVGRALDNAGRNVRQGLQTAGDAVQGGFVRTRTSVHNMEVVSRVYSRLHWDKLLTTSNLELDVTNGGIATVTGVVPDAAAKAKALALTAETVGVIQVVDQVVVTPPTPPIRPGAAPIVPGTPPTVIAPRAETPLFMPPGASPTVYLPLPPGAPLY